VWVGGGGGGGGGGGQYIIFDKWEGEYIIHAH